MASLCSTNHTMALSSSLALNTSGGSACSGKLFNAREIRSRTSLVAASISRSSSNSMEIFERPTRLFELIDLTPSIPLILSSRTWVILLSTIAADAPGYEVLMLTTGGSISGYSRSGKVINATMPKVINNKLITVANTGRFTEISDKITRYSPKH